MTQQPLRELAKQGNVKALALLLQVGLQTQGLTVKAAIQKGSLLIFIESDEIPEEQTSVKFIRHKLMDLGLIFFHLVKIYGRRRGAEEQAWNHEFGFLHINKLFVSPIWRRRGLGSVLVKRFMEETNQPLYVISLQKLAKFYTRLGFVTWLSSAAIITLVYEDK